MKARLHSILWLGALLASCDKSPEKTAAAPDRETSAPKVTKSVRPAAGDEPTLRNRMREAIGKADEIASPEERNRAIAAAIWDAVDTEPEQAREDVHKLTAGSEEKNSLISHLAMRLADSDVDAAINWSNSFESDEEKSLALGNVALVISADDPAKAAHLLSDSGVAGRDFDVSLVQVVQRWAAQSPNDAAAWVALFEPGEARSAALKEVITEWAVRDPRTAAGWISNHADESIRQDGSDAMAEALLVQPDAVQEQLLQSVTPEMRMRFEKLKAEAAKEEAADPE
jgi:hypothetical protein